MGQSSCLTPCPNTLFSTQQSEWSLLNTSEEVSLLPSITAGVFPSHSEQNPSLCHGLHGSTPSASTTLLKEQSQPHLLSWHHCSRPRTSLDMTASLLFGACPQDWQQWTARTELTAPYGHRQKITLGQTAASGYNTPTQQPRGHTTETPHSDPFLIQ